MTIAEMHVWFRQYAQQMGMQNVRAILPEQIDLVINSSITDTVNQVITQNIGVTNDRIITDNSKIGQINALRSLYKVVEVNAVPNTNSNAESNSRQPFVKGIESYIERIWASVDWFEKEKYYSVDRLGEEGSYTYVMKEDTSVANPSDYNTIVYSLDDLNALATAENYNNSLKASFRNKFDYLYLVDLSINYDKGNSKGITNYFPVRLIDDAYLADTLNDFVLRPRLRTPIAVLYNNQLDLYIDILEGEDNAKHLPQNLNPNKLRVSYIGKPAKVEYKSDIGGHDVNCDLPEYMHVDILKHAVDLYRIAITGGMYGAQQQQQAQNREIARNNARPDNEGYQS